MVIRFSWLGFSADHDPAADVWEINYEAAECFEVVACDGGAGFRFDGHHHIAQDEINFDSAGESPVREGLLVRPVLGKRRQLVKGSGQSLFRSLQLLDASCSM